jgi:hypothetical protein
MVESAFHPEDKARSLIDKRLVACGWLIQSKAEMNLGAGPGVAVREFQTASSEQAARYIADVPKHLVREEGQVRFEYVASGTETLFRDHGDPDSSVAPRFHLSSTGDVGATPKRTAHSAWPSSVNAGLCHGWAAHLPN